jgi:UPF0176 protein
MSHQILLFYKYIDIPDTYEERMIQTKKCKELGLTGRMIIAFEGLNATFEGTDENIKLYCDWLIARPGFEDIHLKFSNGTGESFPKLSIKERPEIVSAHLGREDLDPREITGKYLTASELHDWIHSDKEFYIVDMRNDYEHSVGHFAGSILPKFENFRDLGKILPELEHLKDKTVVTVCTGGVRCEKASGFLVKQGFKDIYQLFGGIVTYMEKYPNQDFKGKLYVFDQRITMGFNVTAPEHEVIGRCQKCQAKSERFVNCSYNGCHKHFICCENCAEINGKSYCTTECKYSDFYEPFRHQFRIGLLGKQV